MEMADQSGYQVVIKTARDVGSWLQLFQRGRLFFRRGKNLLNLVLASLETVDCLAAGWHGLGETSQD